jgi:hypothetical protein
MKFSLLTYKVSAYTRAMWFQIIQAESYNDAIIAASKQFNIPIKHLSAILWQNTPHS